jgi:hypothetical protein
MRPDELWERLPATLRRRDEEAGGVLHALLRVMAATGDVVDADLDLLADDWYIETCEEWLVPYIGDLVGTAGLHDLGDAPAFSNRARVADTLRFRRRKGTAAMLEELARTTTGWAAHAVELFEVMSATQHVNHVRPGALATASIRDAQAMELVDTPFDPTAHTADVRPIRRLTGWYNLPHIGLFVWPIASVPLHQVTPAPIPEQDGMFHVDPLGNDHRMYAPMVAEPGIEHRSDETNVPGPLRRRPLHDELDRRRAGSPEPPRWFLDDDPAFRVWRQQTANDALTAVPYEQVHVCDLSDPALPTGDDVRVDPVNGRLSVALPVPHRLAVSWSMASAGDVGAGPWPRPGQLGAVLDEVPAFCRGISATDAPVAGEVVSTFAQALTDWEDHQDADPGSTGLIVVMDSHRYAVDLTGPNRIRVRQGNRLAIVAATWPLLPVPDLQALARRPGVIDPAGTRPCLVGDIEVEGEGTGDQPGELWLDGLLINGDLTVIAPAAGPGLGRLSIAHTTVVPAPDTGKVTVAAGNDSCAVTMRRAITAKTTVPDASGPVDITESIVQAPDGSGDPVALAAAAADVRLIGVTLLGTGTARSLRADDSLLCETVTVARLQRGCVRFSYVAPGSVTPRRHHCPPEAPVPAFGSTWFGSALFARLAEEADVGLRTGAESGAELGAYRFVRTPQRVANLLATLDDHLPLGRLAAPVPVLPEEGE